MSIKRRDLLEASRLLSRHRLSKPGEMDTPALMLAVTYLDEKREGKTDLPFPEWLDGEFEGDELDQDEGSPDPT